MHDSCICIPIVIALLASNFMGNGAQPSESSVELDSLVIPSIPALDAQRAIGREQALRDVRLQFVHGIVTANSLGHRTWYWRALREPEPHPFVSNHDMAIIVAEYTAASFRVNTQSPGGPDDEYDGAVRFMW